MADPLSGGAGVVGVVSLAMQVIQVVTQFGLDWRDAPTEVQAFMKELQVLASTLSATQMNILQNPDFAAAFENRESTLLSQLGPDAPKDTDSNILLQSCEAHLQELLQNLRTRAKGHRLGWDRLKGAFLAKHTRESVEKLHRQCQALNNLVVIDAVALGARTHADVKAIQREQQDGRQEQKDAIRASQKWRQDGKVQDIVKWLSLTDYGSQQSDFFRLRQEGTGQWLLASTAFQKWCGDSKATLYCEGMPGAGKTIMTSIIVDYLSKKHAYDPGTGIAYMYCNFRRSDEQKPHNLLASILKQLVMGRPQVPDTVDQLYNYHRTKETQPSLSEILKELHSITAAYSKCFIIVDALDECPNIDGGRRQFISELRKLQTHANVNILATSRMIPEIAQDLGTGYVSLEIRASDEDVGRYLEGQIHQLPNFVQRSTALQEVIKSGIVNTVKGMFLLAQLHLKSLTSVKSVRVLKARLEALPRGSDAYNIAYVQAMERIQGQNPDARDLALQVLSWISCARRPLTVQELQHALAVEENEPELHEDNISEAEDIVSVCAGLVVIDEETRVIRLVHYTTQEFFEREWSTWFPTAQVDITKVCITYLMFDSFESGFCDSDESFATRLRANPLYDYAARNWGHHAQTGFAELGSLLLCFLMTHGHVSACSQALQVSTYRYGGYSQYIAERRIGLHLAAHFGLVQAVNELLSRGLNADLTDSRARTPLSLAASEGHKSIVKLLVERNDVEADSKDEYGRTPLSWAALEGYEPTVKLLVERGDVEADSKDKEGRTPLSRAASGGHESIVKLLIERDDVEADSKDEHGRTPLSWTASRGHESIVKLLIERDDVEADFKDEYGRTPLSWAASGGYESIVKLLIERDDVEADSKDKQGRTPLSWAVLEGHKSTVELLVARDDVEADSKDEEGWTPLSWAASEGHESIVELLIERDDVEADSKDKQGRTPLSWAASGGHESIVKLLVERDDVETDSKDKHGRTPLFWAASRGHESIVKLLVKRDDVEADSKDKYGRTPLSRAASKGYESIVKLLVERDDVEANFKDKNGRTPLFWAVSRGHESIVKLLVKRDDIEADSKDERGRTPLS